MAPMIGDDGLGEAVQPACPTCGTVLRTLRRGFECRGCGRTVEIPWVERPTGADDLPGAWG